MIKFIEGAWNGLSNIGPMDMHWTQPRGGEMLGMYRAFDAEDNVSLMEYLSISENGEELTLRIRYFMPDLLIDNDSKLHIYKSTTREENRVVFEAVNEAAAGYIPSITMCTVDGRMRFDLQMATPKGLRPLQLKFSVIN